VRATCCHTSGTLPKARSDRLALLRATRANLDPIWGLSLASGLTDAIGPLTSPVTATDEHGAHHAMSPIVDPACAEMVRKLVASAPVVLADGHHRFETACSYRDERPDDDRGAGSIMTLIVELADEQLCVRPIHRLITDIEVPAAELRHRLAGAFDIEDLGANTPAAVDALTARMTAAAAMGFADSSGLALLRTQASGRGRAARRCSLFLFMTSTRPASMWRSSPKLKVRRSGTAPMRRPWRRSPRKERSMQRSCFAL